MPIPYPKDLGLLPTLQAEPSKSLEFLGGIRGSARQSSELRSRASELRNDS